MFKDGRKTPSLEIKFTQVGYKPSPSVVMVNLRALKYSMSFAKGIDFIAFCFLGRLYCYT